MLRQQLYAGLLLLGGGPLLSACLAAEAAGEATGYLREDIYDTAVHADEALVNVRVAASRWPDCTTLESAVADIFRLEGVTNKPDQDKALALWKWFRILVSATGGSYAYEGPRGQRPLVSTRRRSSRSTATTSATGRAGRWRPCGGPPATWPWTNALWATPRPRSATATRTGTSATTVSTRSTAATTGTSRTSAWPRDLSR